jgi:hypothetical protein
VRFSSASRAAVAAVTVAVAAVVTATGATVVAYRDHGPPGPVAGTVGVVTGRWVGAATSDLRAFDRLSGVRCNLTLRYLAWGTPLPTEAVDAAAAEGAATLVELLPYGISLQAVARGAGDGYLRGLGRAVAASRQRVWLSFAPEMNGTERGYDWSHAYRSNTPALYRAAYQRVHRVVTGAGATDVDWVWQPTHAYPGTETPLAALYPGDGVVDTVGIDGYYYRRTDTFAGIFGSDLSVVRHITDRPVVVSETAAGPLRPTGPWGAGQAAKIANLTDGLRRYDVVGVLWFDYDQIPEYHTVQSQQLHQDWQLAPGSAGAAAFRRDVRSFAEGR